MKPLIKVRKDGGGGVDIFGTPYGHHNGSSVVSAAICEHHIPAGRFVCIGLSGMDSFAIIPFKGDEIKGVGMVDIDRSIYLDHDQKFIISGVSMNGFSSCKERCSDVAPCPPLGYEGAENMQNYTPAMSVVNVVTHGYCTVCAGNDFNVGDDVMIRISPTAEGQHYGEATKINDSGSIPIGLNYRILKPAKKGEALMLEISQTTKG